MAAKRVHFWGLDEDGEDETDLGSITWDGKKFTLQVGPDGALYYLSITGTAGVYKVSYAPPVAGPVMPEPGSRSGCPCRAPTPPLSFRRVVRWPSARCPARDLFRRRSIRRA